MERPDVLTRRERSVLARARKLASRPPWARHLLDFLFASLIGSQLLRAWWLREADPEQAGFRVGYAVLLGGLLWLAGRYDTSLLLLAKLDILERPVGDPAPRTAPSAPTPAPEAEEAGALERADLERLARARAYDGRFEPLLRLYATVAALPLVSGGLALALLELPRPLELAVVGSGALASGAALSALRLPGWMRLAWRLERRLRA
jgi:hypothetical protein